MIVLAVCLCSKSVCAEGEETVVVVVLGWWRGSICCALWAHDKLTPVKSPPPTPPPPFQLAWQKTPNLTVISSMLNNGTVWEEPG